MTTNGTASNSGEDPGAVTDRRALEAFVMANMDLETLEALLAQFNIFDAIGVARQELRHSDFLAFLLDPRQTHGLGDSFLKRFLQHALIQSHEESRPIGPIDLDVWSLDRTAITREWRSIDLLLTDEPHRLAVIIENKIGSVEHSDQLGRYLRIVREAYPGWKVLPLYLTPEGNAPSEAAYLPVDYGVVCVTVEAMAESRRTVLDPVVHALMTHYARMLRREVVSDSEVAELCRRIYLKHKRALDLIYEHRPSLQDDLSRLLAEMVQANTELVLDGASRASVRFAPKVWETVALKAAEGWTSSGLILLFEFANRANRMDLNLYVGPGPNEVRQRLIDAALTHRPPMIVARRKGAKWTMIYRRQILRGNDYENAGFDALESRVRDSWESFISTVLPAIVEAMHIEGLTFDVASTPGPLVPTTP
jgi:hypothetical protein